ALGAAYYRVPPRNFDAVKRCWFNALNVHPNEVLLSEQLFDLARQQNDDLGLISVMAHVDKAYGESSPESMYFHGKQLLWNYQRDSTDKDSLESASDISQRMTELRPEWHLSALLDAEVNDLQKRPEAAIRAYQNALKLGPPRASAVQRLVVLLTEEGKFGDARVELAKINPLPQELKRYQVLLEAMSGDPDKALRALQDAIPPASTNPDDWIWVGQIYTHLKRPKEAGQAFRKAVTVGTSYARTWLTMVEFLVRKGQSADAENYVRNSENHLAVDQAPLALAKAYALLGHREMAELHFESAMVSSGDDPATIRSVAMYYYDTGQVAKAEQYIKRLLRITDSSGPSASPQAIWARRSLARAMGREEDYGRFVTAMAILDANRVDGRLSLVDERIKAELMGRREEPQFRERAVQILERLNNQNVALSAEERLVLARLYDKSDRSVQAVEIMTGLVSETGDKPNPDFLAAFSQMLLDRKEYGRANTWIEKLAKIEPKMLRTVRLQARAAMGFNNPDEARRLINEGLQDNRTSANGGQILQAALLMEEFGLNTDAAEKFSEFIKLRPDRFFMYAGFLARSGQVDKTFELCASKESEETVGTICRIGMLAFLEYPEKSIPHFSTLQKWFDAAIAQDPGDVTLSMNWASVLHAMGKSDDAQSVLKAALKADLSRRERGILVNNLAYLNATRGNVDADTIRLVETAVELIGPSRDVLDSRAMIHLAQGNCEKAVKDLENATMFGTDSGILYFHLALAYQCEDDREAAKRTMEKAKAVDFAPRRLSTIEREKYHELASWLAL
ncbi:MAG: tetratricopeptide repeat protein, partial [Pirellulales bacterium]